MKENWPIIAALVLCGIMTPFIAKDIRETKDWYTIEYDWQRYKVKEFKEVNGRIEFEYGGRLISLPKETTYISRRL